VMDSGVTTEMTKQMEVYPVMERIVILQKTMM